MSMAQADGSIVIDTRVDTTGMAKGTSKVEGMLKKTMSTAKKVAGAIAAVFAVREIIAFSKECIKLGSDLEEVQNVVDVTFGKMSGAIEKFSHEAASQFGMSELSAKQYTSTLGAMLKSSGIQQLGVTTEQVTANMSETMKKNFTASGDAVTDMSIAMTQLAGDMASFYNLDTDTAFQKIRSGISGETEPLKQLGINMSEANLEQFRLTQGMEKAYSQMTQQEKTLLRYNYLLSVTSDAQGDFARTSGSWANQMKVLKLQFDSIKASLGQGFINLFTPVLKMINTLLQGIAKLANAFKAFTELITGKKSQPASASVSGVPEVADQYTDAADSAQQYADATEDAAKATAQARKENDKYISGLDNIHTYQSNVASEQATPSGSKKSEMPNTATAAAAVSDAMDFGSLAEGETVVDKLALKMKALYDAIVNGTKPAVDALKRLYNEGLKRVGEFAWQAAKDFYDEFLVPVGKWVMGEGLPRFINALNDGLMKVDWDKINEALKGLWQQLAPFAIKVGEGLLWFWENVLMPLGAWTMNEVVPRFLNTLSGALKVVNAVIDAAKPGFEWFWKNVLEPIAKWTGEAFLKAWDLVIGGLEKFAKWCRDNPKIIENVAVAITSFFAALVGASVISNIVKLIKTIGTLGSTIAAIVSKLNPVTVAIAAVIAVGVLLWKNWDTISAKAKEIWGKITSYLKKTWDTIKKNATNFINNVGSVISKGWNAIKSAANTAWNGIKSGLTSIWNGIKNTAASVWGGVKSFFSTTWNNIKSTASSAWNGIGNTLKSAWNGLKSSAGSSWNAIAGTISTVFSRVSSGASSVGKRIKDAFVGTFQSIAKLIKTPVNAVVRVINGVVRGIAQGINGMINLLNRLRFTVPSWVPGLGGRSFGFNIPNITSYPQIPYLAKGAVIPPNAPFTAVLGDQKRGTNIETPEKLLRQVVREEAGGAKSYRFQAQINRRVLFDEMIAEAKMRQQATGRDPFDLVTA